jgi:hypothetical protein
MTHPRPTRHLRPVVLAALVAALAALVWPASSPALTGGSDWYHALDVAAALRSSPPKVPVLLIFGGSVARECMVSDRDWAAQVQRRGGPEVLSYNIASRTRTYYEDVALVKALPRMKAIVYIGINLERFCSPVQSYTISIAPDPARSANYSLHHVTQSQTQSLATKQATVRYWLNTRYPVFRSRLSYNLRQVERVILACKRKGLRPVMLDLPRNMAVIGSAFDAPIRQYHRGCEALSDKYGVPFVNFVREARLVNGDFLDLAHLVEPGRPKFQRLLSDRSILLLKRYGMTSPVSETLTVSAAGPGPVSHRT